MACCGPKGGQVGPCGWWISLKGKPLLGWIATDWMIGLRATRNSSGNRVSPLKTPLLIGKGGIFQSLVDVWAEMDE